MTRLTLLAILLIGCAQTTAPPQTPEDTAPPPSVEDTAPVEEGEAADLDDEDSGEEPGILMRGHTYRGLFFGLPVHWEERESVVCLSEPCPRMWTSGEDERVLLWAPSAVISDDASATREAQTWLKDFTCEADWEVVPEVARACTMSGIWTIVDPFGTEETAAVTGKLVWRSDRPVLALVMVESGADGDILGSVVQDLTMP